MRIPITACPTRTIALTPLALLLGWVPGSLAQPGGAIPSLRQQAAEVATLLTGVMDTTIQADRNAKAPDVRMITCPIRVAGVQGQAIFLYQEQAMSRDLSKPYRQRFLRIAPSSYSQTVESLSFRPRTPQRWAGLCDRSQEQRIVQVQELGQPVCSVFLRYTSQGYIGSTPVDGCPANVRGAVRITNRVELNADGMNTWDRGFDATGKQVWGAEGDAYQFRRR